MSFPRRPNYSDSQIKRAGKLIKKYPLDSNEYNESLNIINSWRVAHAYPLNTFNSYLRKKVKGLKNAIVAQRLKRLPTIIDKLSRHPNMSLTTMQDIGGLRAILSSVADVKKVKKEYLQSKGITHQIKDVKDYIDSPKASGYRGVHLIYKYNNTKSRNNIASSYKGMLIEIQLRTYLQHMWATAVETVSIFQKEDYKSGYGKKEWLEFFSLVSAVFAFMENSPTLPQYTKLDIVQTIEKLVTLENKFKFLNQIAGYSFAVKVTSSYSGYYNVIVLNYDKKEVTVKSFNKNELLSASKYLAKVERAASSGKKLDPVLVSAGRLKKIKKAYPNYFLDMKEFLEKVNIIVKEGLEMYNKIELEK